MVDLAKPSRSARRLAKHKTRTDAQNMERNNKAKVRRRDGYCRFPFCGCRKLRFPLVASHIEHKGMGGNPAGDRSLPEGMITLCDHRHQHGAISIHRGTLRIDPLTEAGAAGPCAYSVESRGEWLEIARERARHQYEHIPEERMRLLLDLGRMVD